MENTIIEENKDTKKPNIILGLDISTACIGISLVSDDGVNEPEILFLTHVAPKIPSSKKGIEALILRKEIFEKVFLKQVENSGITECVIESPLKFATGNSNPQTVSQLLQFNGLLSEAVYRVLNIIPNYVSSYDARMKSFPELLAIRKFNKHGEIYPLTHFKKSLKDNHLVLFGSYPFDCDKKSIMMNLVQDKYPNLQWIYDKKGELKKQNYDACDSLICVLGYINEKRYGEMNPKIIDYSVDENLVKYTVDIWGKTYEKKISLK